MSWSVKMQKQGPQMGPLLLHAGKSYLIKGTVRTRRLQVVQMME